jgi:hypothetical protein
MTTRENRCADRGGFWSFIVTPGFKVGRGKDTIATQRTLFMMADAVSNDCKKLAALASFAGTALPRLLQDKNHMLQP